MEMDREGFVVVFGELDPSSSLVSMRLSAVRKLSSRTSERNGDRLVLVHVAARGYGSEAWSELQLASLVYLRLLNLSTTYRH